jgi:uncharacterized membrane protein
MLFMFVAVIVLVLISYRYFNKKSAIITGALLSLSPFAIRIGLEIRMYSMAFCSAHYSCGRIWSIAINQKISFYF